MFKIHRLAPLALGFTLIEMMVVVAIVSVLSVVAVPAYNNYTTKAKFTEVVTATGPVKAAIEICAVAGDCVSGNQIVIPASPGVAGASGGLPAGVGSTDAGRLSFIQASQQAAQASGNPGAVFPPAFFTTPSDALALVEGLNVIEAPGEPGYSCIAAPVGAANQANGCFTWILPTSPTVGELVARGVLVADATLAGVYATNNPGGGNGGGANGSNVPCVGSGPGCSPSSKYVLSVVNDTSGNITATAVTSSGLNGETFFMAPALSGGRVDWSVSGTCQTRAGGALC